MKLLIERMQDLKALYIKQLRMLLSAEEQILDGLERMEEAASDIDLKAAFRSHRQETRVHITRLKHGLQHTAGETDDVKCKSISALLAEAEESIKEADEGPVCDAALILAAQRVEHWEMAGYGAVRNFAQTLELPADAEALNQTLQEEGHADELLSSISDRINHEAMKPA
jgi:ferritin-like metal-binding protein YciE